MNDLSGKDLVIIELLAKGMKNKEIGSQMNLSEKTVKNRLTTIFKKCQVNSRTALIRYAVEKNLVVIPMPKQRNWRLTPPYRGTNA